MSKMQKKAPAVDIWLLGGILLMVAIGLAMLYSASTVESFNNQGSTSFYFLRQLKFGGLIGILGFLIAMRVDYHVWKKLVPGLLVVSLVALVLVKMPGWSFSAGGATRWVSIGGFIFQPSELAKFALICYLASWLAGREKEQKTYKSILPALMIMLLFAALILWQPDMGTMAVLLGVGFVMLFVGGVPVPLLLSLAVVGAALAAVLIKLEPYRMSRILTFLNPAYDPRGIGYQLNQALLAVGAGGLWGYGYGMSRQKYNYLPESLGDSIFAVTAEELGFVRVVGILLLLLFLVLRGLWVAKLAPDMFGRLLASGIITWFALQFFVNIGAMLGLLPLTGITLPLFSYGSSSYIITLVSLGVLLNISRYKEST